MQTTERTLSVAGSDGMDMTKPSDNAVGIRSLFLLIPLFAAAVCAAFAISYPRQITSALDTYTYHSSLGNPQLCISGIAVLDDALISDITEIGPYTPAVCYDAQTADGKKIRLMNIGCSAIAMAFDITDGYVPQLTPYECAVVELTPGTAPAIGSAIRPCDENGEVLLSADGTPCTLTVVGIGENILSALSPISNPTVDYLVYTVSDEAWHTEDAVNCLFLDGCYSDDPYAAAQELNRKHSDVQTAYLAAQAEKTRTDLLAAAETADNAILAQEIVVQNIDNSLDTANLRVAELETRMMDAVAALQAEQQQFISDMEHNEYYAVRQVDLIPRRDRAEEGYAKQEAVIDGIHGELQTAYAERDAIAAERDAAVQTLAELHSAAEQTHAALDAMDSEPQIRAVSWDITTAEQEPGTAAMYAHTASLAKSAWLLCIALAAVFFIGSIFVYSVSRRAVISPSHFAVSALLAALPAVLFGACVLTDLVFAHTFPALTGTFALTGFSPLTLLLLPITALLAVLSAVLGHRIHKNADPKTT